MLAGWGERENENENENEKESKKKRERKREKENERKRKKERARASENEHCAQLQRDFNRSVLHLLPRFVRGKVRVWALVGPKVRVKLWLAVWVRVEHRAFVPSGAKLRIFILEGSSAVWRFVAITDIIQVDALIVGGTGPFVCSAPSVVRDVISAVAELMVSCGVGHSSAVHL
jgi:hypothetical protein